MASKSFTLDSGQRVKKNSGWRLFLQTVIARAYPRLIGQQREKSWMFFDIFLPMLGVAAYVFVYRALNAPEDYIGFVVVGGAMTAFWMNVLWSMSSQLYWEKEQGNLALFIMSPNSMMAILLGMALGGHGRHHAARPGDHAARQPALPGAVCGGQLRAAVGSLPAGDDRPVRHGHDGRLVLPAAQPRGLAHLQPGHEPVYLVSGFYFPIKSFNFWVAAAASIIPLTLGLDAMRQLVFPSGPSLGFLSVPVEIGILVVLCVVFLIGARYLLAYMERLAIREGRLTESRR